MRWIGGLGGLVFDHLSLPLPWMQSTLSATQAIWPYVAAVAVSPERSLEAERPQDGGSSKAGIPGSKIASSITIRHFIPGSFKQINLFVDFVDHGQPLLRSGAGLTDEGDRQQPDHRYHRGMAWQTAKCGNVAADHQP